MDLAFVDFFPCVSSEVVLEEFELDALTGFLSDDNGEGWRQLLKRCEVPVGQSAATHGRKGDCARGFGVKDPSRRTHGRNRLCDHAWRRIDRRGPRNA